jgi:hypothetical protein
MAEQQGFFFLQPQEIAAVASSERAETRRLYIDCIAILHDELAALGFDPLWPTFSWEEAGIMIKECLERLGNEPPWLRGNILANLSRVETLSFQARSLSINEKAEAVGLPAAMEIISEVEEFTNDLLKQYGILRVWRKATQ